MKSNSQYADLCRLSLDASMNWEQKKEHWRTSSGWATSGQLAYLEKLVEDCRMEDEESNYYLLQLANLSFDRASELIKELKERINPERIYIPQPKQRHQLSMVLADQDYHIERQKERRLFVLSGGMYCYIKGWQHPTMYTPEQLQKRTFPVDITKTLKGDPVWSGEAVIF